MKKILSKIALIALVSIFPLSSAFALPLISVGGIPEGTTLTTSEVGATIWDFDSSLNIPFNDFTADTAAVVNGSTNEYAAHGRTNTTNYLTVPAGSLAGGKYNGSIVVRLLQDNQYFGLYWGSIDNYNKISFFDGNVQIASFTGDQVVGAANANGNQIALASNNYINFHFSGLERFDSFKLESDGRAFEVDNIAVGAPVPEPGTLLLFGVGLAGLAGSRLRRKKQ